MKLNKLTFLDDLYLCVCVCFSFFSNRLRLPPEFTFRINLMLKQLYLDIKEERHDGCK